MRNGLTAVSAAIVASVAAAAFAQTALPVPGPGTANSKAMVVYPDGKIYPQAPIGHRQLTPNDLPPDLARREQREESLSPDPGRPGSERTDIDPQLRICRGC